MTGWVYALRIAGPLHGGGPTARAPWSSMVAVLSVVWSTACVSPAPGPYVTAACPLPAGALGYPITAHSVDASLPEAFLDRVARAVAAAANFTEARSEDSLSADMQRWRVVNARGRPYGRSGWNPAADDTASIVFVYHRGQTRPTIRLVGVIGKANDFQRRAFQSALASWKSSTNGELETDTLPMVAPTTVNDSALVLVRFGAEPAREDGVARFAAQELPPALAPGNRPPVFPPEARAINQEGQVRIAFVVDSTGVADVAAVQVLYASSPEFVGAVIAALRRDRFVPAMLNCRSVPVVVEQRFFFKISQ